MACYINIKELAKSIVKNIPRLLLLLLVITSITAITTWYSNSTYIVKKSFRIEYTDAENKEISEALIWEICELYSERLQMRGVIKDSANDLNLDYKDTKGKVKSTYEKYTDTVSLYVESDNLEEAMSIQNKVSKLGMKEFEFFNSLGIDVEEINIEPEIIEYPNLKANIIIAVVLSFEISLFIILWRGIKSCSKQN